MAKASRKKEETFDHSQSGVADADLKAVLDYETKLLSLGRRTTKEVFETGELLAGAAPLIPKKTFGKWVAWITGYTRPHAYSFIKIATELKNQKARFVQAGVPATVMRKLASSLEHVEEVLTEFEAGRRLTGEQVKTIIGGDQKGPKIAPPFQGGIAGLRANAKAKQALMVAEFTRNMTSIIADIEKALEPVRQGKRVLKGHLAENIEHRARLTRFQLENIALPVELNPANASQTRVIPFPEGSPWREVVELLWILGGRASWPPEELATWLTDIVLPALAWSIDNGKKVENENGADTGTEPLGV
jgi:hypothetical protein